MTIPADINSGFIKVGRITGEITQCSYNLNLESNGEYEWGVQAIDNGNKGGLFAKSTLNVSGVDGISNEKENAISIYNKDQTLYYAIEGSGEMIIYGINGILVYHNQIEGAGDIRLSEKGVYVVVIKTDNAIKRQKILF